MSSSDLAALAARITQLERLLARGSRQASLGYSSIEDGAIEVHDEAGLLTAIVGMQADGTSGIVAVNASPPPTPSPPTASPVLGGVAVRWDGAFTDAVAAPLDFSRVEVHVAAVADFAPGTDTLRTTIESPRGGVTDVTANAPAFVRLVARNTSGTAGPPSSVTGPVSPAPVVAESVLDGIVDELALAEGAVAAANLQLGSVGAVALAAGAVVEEKLAKASVSLSKIGSALADGVTQRWVDYMADPAQWRLLNGGAALEHLTGIVDAPSGRSLARASGYTVVRGAVQIPYDPDTLYRISARVRTATPSTVGTDTLYIGALGVAADGVTLVSRSGAATSSSAHYVAASNESLPSASGWVTYVGYLRSRAAEGSSGTGGVCPDPRTPGVLHSAARFFSPILYLNFSTSSAADRSGVMEIDAVMIEALRTGVVGPTNLLAGSVTAGALDADSVTAGKVAADAIGARELQANSVTAVELVAGSVTTDKLVVAGGNNALSDPSFESAYTAALVAAQPFWSQATGGNGSVLALSVDCTATTSTSRNLKLTTVPILAGEQLYLGIDYQASANWVGNDCRFFARWRNGAGGHITTSTVGQAPATPGTWERMSGTLTAPAGTIWAQIWVEANQSSAGTVLWDNAVVRPVVPGVQIGQGQITTPHMVAGSIAGDRIAANSLVGDRIVARSITGDHIKALSVTAAELAANSVTAVQLAAGVVDATHVKAGSITARELSADALNGKVITGALIQTAESGRRIVLNPASTSPSMQIYSGATGETVPGGLSSDVIDMGTWRQPEVSVWSPSIGGSVAGLRLRSPELGGQGRVAIEPSGQSDGYAHITVKNGGVRADSEITIYGARASALGGGYHSQIVRGAGITWYSGNRQMKLSNGVLDIPNIATGSVVISPTAGVPTSVTVTGLNVAGTEFRAFVTANTSVPGTSLLGVGAAGVSGTGVTLWVTRTHATNTMLWWMVVGS